MVTLLYKGRQIGPLCRSIANMSGGKLRAMGEHEVSLDRIVAGTVIRWDSRMPTISDRHVNPPEAVVLSRNKKASRVRMGDLAPQTWTSWLHQRRQFTYPCIIRPRRHYAAQGFTVAHNLQELERAMKKFGYQRWYISPLINKKLEYRVFVFDGKCVKVVRRYHNDPNAIAWNIAEGGHSKKLKFPSWPIPVVKVAIQAAGRLGVGWCAADVIVDQADRPYVLELNTAPGVTQESTQQNLAKVFSWEEPVPPVDLNKVDLEWKDLIHPAIWKKKEKGEPDESTE
jgi:hypothetical protein